MSSSGGLAESATCSLLRCACIRRLGLVWEDARVAQPLIRTKRAARLSLVVSLAALAVFVVLVASVEEGRRLWTWGALVCVMTATFSIITAFRAPE